MKKYFRIIKNLLFLTVTTIIYFFIISVLKLKGWASTPVKTVLEIAWLFVLFAVVENIKESLKTIHKTTLSVIWEFRAKLITYTFTLVIFIVFFLTDFFITPPDDIRRMFDLLFISISTIIYIIVLIKNYLQSHTGLQGMNKEEVFK